MANPRKFSEKIALHNQKQAEETAAFEQVMREVMGATRNAQPQYLHLSPTLGSYRGGSLPNVNQIGNNSIDLQSALTSLEDMKQGKDHIVSDRIQRERGRQTSPHRSRQFPFQKHIDVSPYGSTAYLSPPPDTNWRRTNSDSALHQSAMNLQENVYGVNTSPVRRVHDMDSGIMHDTYNNHVKEYWDPRKQPQDPHQVGLSPPSPHARPKSCEVPDINIYPSQEESSLIHVPISNNTGSLPDLTNLHFPSPLATPLDIEDQSGLVYSQHSPSQSNVVTYSHISSLSPQQHHTHGIGPNVSSGTLIQPTAGVGGGGGSRHNSPGPSPSPSSRRRHHHNSNNLMIGSSNLRHHGLHSSQQQVCYSSPRHEPPRITVEGLTIDTNALSLNNYLPQQPTFGMYPQQQSNQSPHHNYGQGQALSQSQCSQMMSVGPYHSNSVADHSSSVPNSPVSQNFSPINSPGLGPSLSLNKSPFTDNNNYTFHQHQQNHHANILHHQLEQYDVVGESFEQPDQIVMQLPQRRNTTSNKNVSPPNVSTMYHTNFDSVDGSGSQVAADVGMGERNQFHYADLQGEGLPRPQDGVDTNIMYYGISSTVSEPHHHSPTLYSKSTVISSVQQSSPQTPQTPTIILTTPGGEEPLMRQDFAKDIGSAMASMTGSFDTDFFTPDDALRAGLDPIDFDGLQILTDPDISVISDPATEETFRLEHS